MKKIVYTDRFGTCCVITPAEGHRIATGITINGLPVLDRNGALPMPQAADQFMRGWPIPAGLGEVVVDWFESEDDFLSRIAIKDVPRGLTFSIVDSADLPQDRTFRNAWTVSDKAVGVDMEKAREIHKENIRALRTPLFEKNDVAIADAILSDDKEAKVAAAAKRDALRDATDDPAIAAAQTPEELKLAIPDVVKESAEETAEVGIETSEKNP